MWRYKAKEQCLAHGLSFNPSLDWNSNMSVLECPACSLILEAYQPLASGSEGWAHFKSRASSMCQGPKKIGSFRNLKVLSNQIRIAIDAFSRSQGFQQTLWRLQNENEEDFWVLSATCARAKADPTKNAAWGTIARACFILQKVGKVFYNQHSQHSLFHSCYLNPLSSSHFSPFAFFFSFFVRICDSGVLWVSIFNQIIWVLNSGLKPSKLMVPAVAPNPPPTRRPAIPWDNFWHSRFQVLSCVKLKIRPSFHPPISRPSWAYSDHDSAA